MPSLGVTRNDPLVSRLFLRLIITNTGESLLLVRYVKRLFKDFGESNLRNHQVGVFQSLEKLNPYTNYDVSVTFGIFERVDWVSASMEVQQDSMANAILALSAFLRNNLVFRIISKKIDLYEMLTDALSKSAPFFSGLDSYAFIDILRRSFFRVLLSSTR